ncbi:hypothetical protein GCM10011358_11370 [Sinisalibacter lacisalsi]|uniref:Uncharacterized protein n=2 Tax=Sinisalibacter lacisalsi TaxID=1526570 RepID=A0ABQ1QKV8_9RHOB|nr:hypothetical protein GCM10011358_11370 [Sinisalibacter lacisalsi]
MANFQNPRSPITGVMALVAAGFGLLTIFAAGAVLFGPGRDLAGATIPFVLWANLILGFGYIAAAVLLFNRSPWAWRLALAIAAATLIAALGFAVEAMRGTQVEPRTAVALGFRVAFWLLVALFARRARV